MFKRVLEPVGGTDLFATSLPDTHKPLSPGSPRQGSWEELHRHRDQPRGLFPLETRALRQKLASGVLARRPSASPGHLCSRSPAGVRARVLAGHILCNPAGNLTSAGSCPRSVCLSASSREQPRRCPVRGDFRGDLTRASVGVSLRADRVPEASTARPGASPAPPPQAESW